MKGNIFDIKKFAVHDGNGIRTTVFFKGCPLKCIWCHNPEGISAETQLGYLSHKCVNCGKCSEVCPTGAHTVDKNHIHIFNRERCIKCGACKEVCHNKALTLYGKFVTVDEILPILMEDREYYEVTGGGVTLSGGEALLQKEFCLELLTRLKADGINTAVDTCGYVPTETLKEVMPYTDTFLYDIKHMDSETHRRLTGHPNELILGNLLYLSEHDAHIEIRFPLVPTYNDSDDNIKKIGKYISELNGIDKLRVLPYHDYAHGKYSSLGIDDTMPDVSEPDDCILERAVEILRNFKVNAVSGKK